jgi:LysR family hydrogen peroxide-inducible transcriptional activator
MVGAGIGVTFIPEMAAPVETRSAAVSLARFADPRPRRTIGMIWRRSSPLSGQLQHIAGIVQQAADALRGSLQRA